MPDPNLLISSIAVVAAAANFVVLLQIKLSITQLDLRLREWARQTFADQAQIDRRFQQIEEGMRNIEKEMSRVWASTVGKGGC
jgi:hypothetical protein